MKPDRKEIREVKQDKQKKYTKLVKNASILNMGVYDIEAADQIRKRMHEYYFLSTTDPLALVQCYEAAMQFYIVFRSNLPPFKINQLDREFHEVGESLKNIGLGTKIPRGMYNERRSRVVVIIRNLYEAKHIIGLGLPMERRMGSTEKLKEAMNR